MTFYYFVNVSKNIDDFSGKTDIRDIGIVSLFEAIADANNWDSGDIIMAFPDKNNDPTMRYQNGDLELKCGLGKNDDSDDNYDNYDDDDNEIEKKENCTYCNDILEDHTYGNICKKHIPSYALYEESYEDLSNENEYYEELSERKLPNELDGYNDEYNNEYNETSDDEYNERSDDECRYYEDEGYGHENEGYQDETEECY